jgi:TetR/AcrR family transcriptional regulator, cholesterol catabolism regulator
MARISRKKTSTRKASISVAAARLFRERGFSATGMRDLAQEVGMEAASLYNHIRSKSELLQEICFRIAHAFTAQLDKLEQDESLSSLEKLEAVLRFHIRMWVDKLDEVLVTNNESRYLEEPGLSAFLQERRVYVRRLENIIEEGIRKGQVRAIEPYAAVLTLMSAVRGIEFWHRTKKNVSAQQLEESMVANLVSGLRQ